MKKHQIYIFIVLFPILVLAGEADTLLDDNTAFYEGKELRYVILPPPEFKMNTEKSTDDGYSFAFIPEDENYDSANVMIGINIFKIKDKKKNRFTLDQLIQDDTLSYRNHYGVSLSMTEVKPAVTVTNDTMRVIYINDSTRFIPNVMLAYIDGKTEILIFELSISSTYLRFEAEEIFIECLEKIKILKKGTIGIG